MMKYKIIYALLILILFVSLQNVDAQESDSERFAVFFVPQYIITNGIRVDVDFRKAESGSWWVISPYYYSDGSSSSFLNPSDNYDYNTYTYKKLIGGGLGISRKIFITKNKNKGFYAMLGATYKYFKIDGDNLNYVEYTGDDGLTYYEMQDLEYSININSYAGQIILGHQFNPASKFYIDLFIGFGVKFSEHSSPENVMVKYNRGAIDYGYSGTQFIGGARFGIALF